MWATADIRIEPAELRSCRSIPPDHRDVEIRLAKASRKFEAYARPAVLRQTTLASPVPIDLVKAEGWTPFGRDHRHDVRSRPCRPADTPDHLPTHDISRFVDANLATTRCRRRKPALAEVINATGLLPSGLFMVEDPQTGPLATVLCVQDNDLAGIMSFSVTPARRREGSGLRFDLGAAPGADAALRLIAGQDRQRAGDHALRAARFRRSLSLFLPAAGSLPMSATVRAVLGTAFSSSSPAP